MQISNKQGQGHTFFHHIASYITNPSAKHFTLVIYYLKQNMASKANSLTSIAKLFLHITFLTLTLTLHAKANEGNVLLTGDVLTTDSQLSYGTSSFVMQGDCNLILYNFQSGFQSNTHGQGTNCTLTLNNMGQFVIRSRDGTYVWSSSPTSTTKKGNYAAVLRPDGQVAVYGPAVWSTTEFHFDIVDDEEVANKAAVPNVRNVLFSSQVLYNNAELASRDYTFVMGNDCNLVLNKAAIGVIWQSNTAGKGKHCFARLGHSGQLVVEDDKSRTVWSTKPAASKDGDYVLIMQINGQAVIYGPVVWSTSSN